MSVKLSDIASTNWSLSLETQGEVVQGLDEINQCIYVIVTTQRGTDPIRPEFGCSLFDYIDRSIIEAIPKMIVSIVDAINEFETRVDVTKLTYEIQLGAVTFSITWKEKTTAQTGITNVTINGIK